MKRRHAIVLSLALAVALGFALRPHTGEGGSGFPTVESPPETHGYDETANSDEGEATDPASLIDQATAELLQTEETGQWYAEHMGAPGHWSNAWKLLADARAAVAPRPPPPAPEPPPPPPPPPPPATISWNPNVTRTPIRTTIPEILGSQQNSLGGATETGGGFPNHPHWRRTTPSEINSGRYTLVEVDGVMVTNNGKKLWGHGDGDATIGLTDPNRSDIANLNMKSLHAEVAVNWTASLIPPQPLVPNEHVWPPAGTLVDIQGIVMWDPNHTTAGFHWYSGWEVNPVTAWRLHK
jgi:hypothetical protein